MIEKHFEDLEHYQLTAAQVGVHHQRWTAVSEEIDLADIRKIMAEKQYDILPVQSDGAITHYYTTLERGKFSAEIEKREIQAEDKLYYLTQIEDVMRLFHEQKRAFFFLWDYQHVLGLISDVNLKSTPVSVYLYTQSNALEIALSKLFLLAYDEKEFKEIVWKNAKTIENVEDRNKRLEELEKLFERHAEEQMSNEHLHLIEQLSLRDLFDVLRKQGWLKPFGYKNKPLKTISKLIKNVRNYISHPVRDSISNEDMLKFLAHTRELIAVIAKAELGVHYRKTHYKVKGHEVPIEIGKPLPESLKKLCKSEQGWCFITAFNPASKSLDPDINQLLNAQLKSELQALDLQLFEAQGESTTSDHLPELSFWVPDIGKEKAEELGLKYGQNAIVYGQPKGLAELLMLNLEVNNSNV